MAPREHEASQRLSLSELVERTDVPASTIHHYRRAGLIPPPQRSAANRFCYDERHVEALRLVRMLRERTGLPLEQIAVQLRDLEANPASATDPSSAWDAFPAEPPDARVRVIDAAIEAFQTRSFAEVTVRDVAESAGVAKGSVYRHFASKEDLFTAAIETMLDRTAEGFAAAVEVLGGPVGLAGDPEKGATVFAGLVADALPILLELGARAAKGHEPSQELARTALRTLAEAAGRPLSDDPVPAGLALIETAFATVLQWALLPDSPLNEPSPEPS
jgi:AcrR family transcriptional regulator